MIRREITTDPGAPRRVLLVEDEAHLGAVIAMNLQLDGHAVTHVTTGAAARQALDRARFHLVLLDVMLPDTDGMALCRQMRRVGDRTPVLMLTALGETADRVAGLDAGADDYLPKPFELAELRARVAAMLRRGRWTEAAAGEPAAPPREIVRFGRAVVDFTAHEAAIDGEPITLTALELDLLRYFVARPDRAISREQLLEDVWGVSGSNTTRTVDNFVMRLRRHFEPRPSRPRHFVSVRGVGYKFVPDA